MTYAQNFKRKLKLVKRKSAKQWDTKTCTEREISTCGDEVQLLSTVSAEANRGAESDLFCPTQILNTLNTEWLNICTIHLLLHPGKQSLTQ